MEPLSDLSTLAPGIRRTVVWLRELGFHTCDSGDGKSNSEMDCAMDIPHVHMTCPADEVTEVADDLFETIRGQGVTVGGDLEGPSIQATYNPVDRIAVVSLFNVDDNLLFGPIVR